MFLNVCVSKKNQKKILLDFFFVKSNQLKDKMMRKKGYKNIVVGPHRFLGTLNLKNGMVKNIWLDQFGKIIKCF